MLTNSDLQAIQKLLDPIQKDVSGLKTDVAELKKDNKDLKKSVKKIDSKTDLILRVLDKEQMHQRKRLKRIENHLELAPLA